MTRIHIAKMKIAVIGQSRFGADVYNLLRQAGHEIVGVFTIPDVKGRQDPLGYKAFTLTYGWMHLVIWSVFT